MKKSVLVIVLMIVIFALTGGMFFSATAAESEEAPDTAEDQIVLYVQEGCSHCAKVEAFLEKNDLMDELVIKDTSVDASEEYVAELERLGVPLEESGVPMLVYDGDQYLVGDSPIISFLEERFSIQEADGDPVVADSSDYIILLAGVLFVGGILGYGIVKAVNERRSDS